MISAANGVVAEPDSALPCSVNLHTLRKEKGGLAFIPLTPNNDGIMPWFELPRQPHLAASVELCPFPTF